MSFPETLWVSSAFVAVTTWHKIFAAAALVLLLFPLPLHHLYYPTDTINYEHD